MALPMSYYQKYQKYKQKYRNLHSRIVSFGGAGRPTFGPERQLMGFCPGDTKIIYSHGYLVNRTFHIPLGVRLIYMSVVGEPTPFNRELEQQIDDIYTLGETLFNDRDTTHDLTENGTDLEGWYTQTFRNRQIGIHNHIGREGGLEVNDLSIDFWSPPCEREGDRGYFCGIRCYPEDGLAFGREAPRIQQDALREVSNGDSVLLSTIIDQLGQGTYIVVACRLPGPLPVNLDIARQISDRYRRQQELTDLPSSKPL
jgi:hypothetical protein